MYLLRVSNLYELQNPWCKRERACDWLEINCNCLAGHTLDYYGQVFDIHFKPERSLHYSQPVRVIYSRVERKPKTNQSIIEARLSVLLYLSFYFLNRVT